MTPNYSQGDIVSVEFPYTENHSKKKLRPALIISNDFCNSKGSGILMVPITTSTRLTPFSFILDNRFLERSLPQASEIRCDKIFTFDKKLIIKKVSSIIINEKIDELLKIVWSLFERK